MEILSNAAHPSSISQRDNNTCSVTTIETATYTKFPSVAAKVVTDLALTGKYRTADGITVATSPVPKTSAAGVFPAGDGQRSHASEIFQVAAVNVHYAGKREPYIYDAFKEARGESGEMLMDMTFLPPKEFINNPGLNTAEMAGIYRSLTGHDVAIIEDRDVPSPEHLKARLAELKYQGKLPAIVLVNPDHILFENPLRPAHEYSNSAPHVVTITDVAPDGKFVLDNQWKKADDKLVEPEQFYMAMLTDAQIWIKRVSDEVDAARAGGAVNVDKELELLFAKRVAKPHLEGAELQKELDDVIDLVSVHLVEKGSDEERVIAGRKLFDLSVQNGERSDRHALTVKKLFDAGFIDAQFAAEHGFIFAAKNLSSARR